MTKRRRNRSDHTSRRALITMISTSAVAGVIGNTAYETIKTAAGTLAKELIHRIETNEVFELPIWTGTQLILVESILDHNGEDIILHLLKILQMYPLGEDCVSRGRESIDLALAAASELGLHILVDVSQLDLSLIE